MLQKQIDSLKADVISRELHLQGLKDEFETSVKRQKEDISILRKTIKTLENTQAKIDGKVETADEEAATTVEVSVNE